MEARRPEPESEAAVEPSAADQQRASTTLPPTTEPQPSSEPQPQPQPEGTGADLLTISLLVFFVSLLLIVAGMLVLPNIVH